MVVVGVGLGSMAAMVGGHTVVYCGKQGMQRLALSSSPFSHNQRRLGLKMDLWTLWRE